MIEELLAFLFPEHCIGCQKSGMAVCVSCIEHIPLSNAIADPSGKVQNAFAIYDYSDPMVSKAIWELKYHRKSAAAKALAQYGACDIVDQLASVLQSSTPMNTVLVPVPQYFSKTLNRGFNQSNLIARWINAGLPDANMLSVLKKIRATDSQAHTHSRKQRQENLAHTMEVSAQHYPLNPHALYIVVDDVITTGSTIDEASRALRAAGAQHIYAIALAHGYAKRV